MSKYSYTRTHDGKYLVKGPIGYFKEEFKTEEEAKQVVEKWEKASQRNYNNGREKAEKEIKNK